MRRLALLALALSLLFFGFSACYANDDASARYTRDTSNKYWKIYVSLHKEPVSSSHLVDSIVINDDDKSVMITYPDNCSVTYGFKDIRKVMWFIKHKRVGIIHELH